MKGGDHTQKPVNVTSKARTMPQVNAKTTHYSRKISQKPDWLN